MKHERALDALASWQADSRRLPLPPPLYTDESVTALEKDRLFAREWICVGHQSELKAPGDYLTFDLLDTPVVVTRNRAGELGAFSNVCAHRSARLLDGRGHCAVIVCPYHSWSYDLDGRLRGAPFMEPEKIDGIRLPVIRLETWEGMIFVNLDNEAPPLGSRLEALHGRIGNFGIGGMHVAWRFDERFDCNWKVLIENFCESYHVFRVHKTTLEPETPTASVEVLPDGPGFNHHTMDYPAKDGGAGKEHLACLYPGTTLAVRAGGILWLSVLPVDAGTCRLTGWLARGPDSADDIDASIAATREFLAEDKAIIAGVQAGLASGAGNVAPLSDMEATNWQFGRYLAERLLA